MTRSGVTATGPDVPGGEVHLYDNYLPPLAAGDYVVSVEQEASGKGFADKFRHDQRMRVTGPHLELAPGDVLATYPPPGSTGDYHDRIPHVILSRRRLPWETSIGGSREGAVVAPWMALLLLTPEELVPSDAGGAGAGSTTVAVADYLRPPSGYLGPKLDDTEIELLEKEAGAGRSVVVVDVAPSAFEAIAPAWDELPYLAHVRREDTDHQEVDVAGDGWSSLVLGNRLCDGSATGTYLAHLVSVEGFSGYLPPARVPGGVKAVRLLSLTRWTFNATRGEGDFAAVMKALDVGALRMPALVHDPRTPEEKLVAHALAAGYCAVESRTRVGETTTAWYRGPCLPVRMVRNPQAPYATAGAAEIYDPKTAMFDVSFAVAWEAGRLATLANRQITVSLLRWLRRLQRDAQHLLGRLHMVARGWFDAPPQDPRDLLRPDLVAEGVRRHLTDEVGPRIAPPDPSIPSQLAGRTDPSGLDRVRATLPGLLRADEVAALLAVGGNPSAAAIDRVRRRARTDAS